MSESLKTDCRHFLGDRPCAPHKQTGVVCSSCTEAYDPIRTRLVLIKLAAMGDVLRTTSLLPAIHRRWPGAHVTWVTEPASVPLLATHPSIDRVVPFTGDVPLPLKAEHFDVVLNPDAAAESCALAHVTRADERHGFDSEPRGGAPVPLSAGAEHWLAMGVRDDLKRDNRRTYQDLMADVLELDYRREPPHLELDEPHRRAGRAARARVLGDGTGLVVGLNTGAGGRWRHKRWTESGYAELIQRLGAEGHRVLLLGGPGEQERNGRLAAGAPGVALDTGGDNDVLTFAGLVEACDAMVTGDTLAMHVAIARGTPVIVLFGPTSLHEIDVFEQGERLAPDMPCLCCYLTDCDVRPTCQESIPVDAVHEALLRVAAPAPS